MVHLRKIRRTTILFNFTLKMNMPDTNMNLLTGMYCVRNLKEDCIIIESAKVPWIWVLGIGLDN